MADGKEPRRHIPFDEFIEQNGQLIGMGIGIAFIIVFVAKTIASILF